MNQMRLFNIYNKPAALLLVNFIQEFALKSKRGRAYKRRYYNLSNKLQAFETFRGIRLYTDSFDFSMMEDFIYFLKNNFPYRPATIVSYQGCLHHVITRAVESGIKVNYGFMDVQLKNEPSLSVALSESDIRALNDLRGLSKEAMAVRDLFLIGCLTGLRFSDYSILSKEQFRDKIITVRTKKTGVSVQIPVHWMVWEVLDRNNGEMPSVKSQQAFNMCIKRVCRKAQINESIIIERTEGFKIVKRTLKKYKLVCSHTARRSFATNLYLRGVEPAKIMLITGHQTESSFFKYIRISKEENARELLGHPFFTKIPASS